MKNKQQSIAANDKV